MEEIKAIETYYKGYRFRSRIEARWAVFFDVLNVEWNYESEGYDLGYGIKYLPDFRIKCYGTRGYVCDEPFDLFIEVKGVMDEKSAFKIKKFSSKKEYWEYEQREMEYIDESIKYIDEKDKINVVNAIRKSYEERNKKPTSHSLLIVNQIPYICSKEDCSDSYIFKSYENFGYDTFLFNYEYIDGDNFAAYPSITEDGRFFLMGDDCNYINCGNYDKLIEAYQTARQARFEYGETPIV